MFLLIFIINEKIDGSFFKYIPEESPKTINLKGGQILVMAEIYQYPTFVITIPEIFSSPRYIASGYKFFSFVNNATVTIHFLTNISFFIANNSSKLYQITNGCDFLLQNFDFECGDDIKIHDERFTIDYIFKKDKNIVKYPDYSWDSEVEIKDFSSQPPYSLTIKASDSLISNATVEVDYGYGKNPISTYNKTFQILPFKTDFYITYNTCESFLFKSVSKTNPSNSIVTLTMNDIPESCFSYSASILVSLDFPNALLFYKLGEEDILSLKFIKGSYVHLSRNFRFNLTFYVKYVRCIDFYVIKTVSVNDHSNPRVIHIFASDIPDICEGR